LGLSEVSDSLRHIRERTRAGLLVDADTGFGNAINVMRTVRVLEAAGANAIQLEDQDFPKRCGHLKGKSLVSCPEMVGKIRAACDARQSQDTLIIGRTDAVAVEGLEPAMVRAERYVEAGADVLFVEGLRSTEQMQQVLSRFAHRVPVLVNMVEGGDTPLQSAAVLQSMGFSLVIFPGALARAFGHMAQTFFASLKHHGSTDPFRPHMLDFTELNALLDTPAILERGQRYSPESVQPTPP
jgi:2-methylisocitrate lyase-like PEP mutase family enzyme